MKNADEMAVEGLVQAFVDGWNAADGSALARPFAADADFTAITGLRAKGRELIAKGHDEILATIYRGSVISARVEGIRFLTARCRSGRRNLRFRWRFPAVRYGTNLLRDGVHQRECGLVDRGVSKYGPVRQTGRWSP